MLFNPTLDNTVKTIGIASGKGGVGKSTIAMILARRLSLLGLRVGIIDADIYGPSQADLLGVSVHQCPVTDASQIIPQQTGGLHFVSVAGLMKDDKPLLWRAPVVTRVISDFLTKVQWPPLDYVIVDLPPGTGDIHITLAQNGQLDGVFIVTTPQKVAARIAAKALQMFQMVKVPVWGIIENMSHLSCAHCHGETPLFKGKGGAWLNKAYDVPVVARLPFSPVYGQWGDDFTPSIEDIGRFAEVTSAFDSVVEVALNPYSSGTKPTHPADHFCIGPQGELILSHGRQKKVFPAFNLRAQCPCALCRKKRISEKSLQIETDMKILSIHPMGHYGLKIHFSDGHKTGIYSLSSLDSL